MKTTLIISLILILGLTASILHKESEMAEISLFRDVTEEHLAQPGIEDIKGLYDLTGGSKWKGVDFRFSAITDVSFLPVREITIEPANRWLSNEFERDKEVQQFNAGVEEILSRSANDSVGKSHSSVYAPLSRELERLSKSKAQRRILVLFSDLLENTLSETLYSKGRLDPLRLNEESLKKMFEHEKLLPDLTGIEVYLIYQPADAEKDREYNIVSEFYRKLLESKGAKVTVGGNLQI